jgi:hypothetical protein
MKWWQQLDPKQRKVIMAAGGGIVLAVVVLAARGARTPAAPEEAGGTGAAPAGVDPYATTSADTGPSSFADNGAGFGQLSTAISDGLGQVGTSLDNVSSSTTDLGERLTAVEAAAAAAAAAANKAAAGQKPPGQLAQTGRPAAPAKPKPKLFAGKPLSWWQNPANAKKNGKWKWPGSGYVHTRRFEAR